MPNTRTAPRKAARRIARKRLREPGRAPGGRERSCEIRRPEATAQPEGAPDSFGPKWAAAVLMDREEFCTGCQKQISLKCDLRPRGGRVYCRECVDRPLPTHAYMVSVVARAFDVIAAVARRGDGGYLGDAVARYAQNELRPELAGFDWDEWQHLADIWEHLAYRPLETASPLHAH
jgi:hypothetical protein